MSRYRLWFAAFLLAGALPVWGAHLNFPNPVDVDKSNPNWLVNWYDDVDNNGVWTFVPDNLAASEPFADAVQPGWVNPKQGRDDTCWLAVAANMLDVGGYGLGSSIYNNVLIPHYGWTAMGSVDAALAWYIASHGAGVSPYTVINVYNEVGGAMGGLPVRDFISSELRTPDILGLEIKPLAQGVDHAVTPWGDDLLANWAPGQPSATQLHITDSDMDVAGDYPDPLRDQVDVYGWVNNTDLNYLGGYHAARLVTLEAVPEPGTLAVVGLGLLALALRMRRRSTFAGS